jgi:hypothetical protein
MRRTRGLELRRSAELIVRRDLRLLRKASVSLRTSSTRPLKPKEPNFKAT